MMKAVKGITLVSIGGLEDSKGRADYRVPKENFGMALPTNEPRIPSKRKGPPEKTINKSSLENSKVGPTLGDKVAESIPSDGDVMESLRKRLAKLNPNSFGKSQGNPMCKCERQVRKMKKKLASKFDGQRNQ